MINEIQEMWEEMYSDLGWSALIPMIPLTIILVLVKFGTWFKE